MNVDISFSSPTALSDDEARAALKTAVAIVRKNIPQYTELSQASASVGGVYPTAPNTLWTNGFWVGELWLAYQATGDSAFRDCADAQVRSMDARIRGKIAVDHHDMGFLYSPSCVAAWKITGDSTAREAALRAAEQLASRYQPKGQFLQAWGAMGAQDNYRYIIDCLLNTPLLYWASRETGEARYADIARAHTRTCMAHSIRADGSTYHTFFMDSKTGAPLYGRTCQGYADDSVWARGQAWGVYGSALANRYDAHESYRDAFRRTVRFFLQKLPRDNVPYWDMIFNDDNATHDGEREPKDSSAASIVVCGLLDMAAQLSAEGDAATEEAARYTHTARVLLKSLVDGYRVREDDKANGLVLHGTYSKRSPYNTCTPEGVDECVSWGDYFYMEALTRLVNPQWDLYW